MKKLKTWGHRYRIILFLILLVCFNIIIGSQFLKVGLDRDEGEQFSRAEQFLYTGILYGPYVSSSAYKARLKPPGFYFFILPIAALCGTSIIKIRLCAILVLTFSSILIFFLAKNIRGFGFAAISAIIFILLVFRPLFLGYLVITEMFLNLVSIVILLLLFHEKDISGNFTLLLGILTGFACFVRVTGVVLFIPLTIAIFYERIDLAKKYHLFRKLIIGALITFLAMIAFLVSSHSFVTFFKLHFVMAKETLQVLFTPGGAEINLLDKWHVFISSIKEIGLLIPFLIFGIFNLQNRKEYIIFYWFLFSLIIAQVAPTAHAHHYLPLFPSMSILMALGVLGFWKLPVALSHLIKRDGLQLIIKDGLAIFILPLLIFYSIDLNDQIKMVKDSGRVCEHSLSYDEQIQIALFLRKNTKPNERIWIFYEMQLPYLAKRYSIGPNPVGFDLYRYINLGEKEIKEYIIQPMEDEKPKFIIITDAKKELIFRNPWARKLVADYATINYELKERIGIALIYERKSQH